MIFKVVNSTNPQWNNIQLPLEESMLELGASVSFLNIPLKVTQWGGGILILSGTDDVITLQEVPEEKTEEKEPEGTIKDSKQLTINKEVDIFFETKEIRLNFDNDLSKLKKEHGVTYDAVYEFLKEEWKTIRKAFPDYNIFPMEHKPGTNNYCFLNSWNWAEDYTLFLKDGCWSRKDLMGRHI